MLIIDSLHSYYKLEETVSTTVTDSHSTNNGTYNGALPTSISAIIDNGQDIVNGDNIDLGNTFDISGDFTINFWHNREAGTGVFARLMAYGITDNAFNLLWQSSTELRFRANFAGSAVADARITGLSGFTMITLVRSGNTAKLYKNGVLGSTSSTFGATGIFNLLVADNGAGNRIIDGKTDEIGLWERELSSSELLELYNSGSGFAYPFIRIAQSKSIEFNNGTITQAKLTTTLTGNPLTKLQMTADGTNFEDVTSGSLHTFSNTGTDLRWKTEGQGTTITELKITDFRI